MLSGDSGGLNAKSISLTFKSSAETLAFLLALAQVVRQTLGKLRRQAQDETERSDLKPVAVAQLDKRGGLVVEFGFALASQVT